MYNRYMRHVQDVDDYVDVEPRAAGAPPPPPDMPPGGVPTPDFGMHMPPFYDPHEHRPPPFPGPGGHEHPHPPEHAFPGHPVMKPDGDGSILARLLGGLHFPKLDFDDLLILLIVFLILREEGDNDLILIAAALFFAGL